jgi:hypothetical protein
MLEDALPNEIRLYIARNDKAGMLSGPILAYRKALKTVYVITNRRAITFDGGRTVTSKHE